MDYLSDDEDEYDKTVLESFNTCIDENDEVDEFIIFKNTLQTLQEQQAQYYSLITGSLTPDQFKTIQETITTANKRAADIG